MQRLESTQAAASESYSKTSSLSEQASHLLANRQTDTSSARVGDKSATSLSFDNNLYGSAEKAGNCTRADNACAWRPDDSSNSQQTKTWRAQRETQKDKPLDTTDGKYEIKPGDTMNDISKRYLKDLGIDNPTNKEIAGLSKMIADQNKDQYSILKCNPSLIRPGMKLDLPSTETISGLWKNSISGTQSADYVGPNGTLGPSATLVPSEVGQSGLVNGFRKDDHGAVQLPFRFQVPNGVIGQLEKGPFSDAIQLPYKPLEDQPGQIMNLPYRPSQDSPGKMMQVKNESEPSFAKRFLENLALPQVMLV